MGKAQTGLTHVEANTIADKEEIIDKKEVEYACYYEIRIKFSLTSNTPLMHVSLSQEIGFDGTPDS